MSMALTRRTNGHPMMKRSACPDTMKAGSEPDGQTRTKAKNCIRLGSPIAIKVGEQWYLVDVPDHSEVKNRLTNLAGHRVTVRGTVTEQNGRPAIAISQVDRP